MYIWSPTNDSLSSSRRQIDDFQSPDIDMSSLSGYLNTAMVMSPTTIQDENWTPCFVWLFNGSD